MSLKCLHIKRYEIEVVCKCFCNIHFRLGNFQQFEQGVVCSGLTATFRFCVYGAMRENLSEPTWDDINLVDPASSHMLVSKIKPCMSQYKLPYGETANGSLKQLSLIRWSRSTWIPLVILELIHAHKPDSREGLCLLAIEPTQALLGMT